MAVQVLVSRGVPEERILFLNLIATPPAIRNLATKFPKVRVVTAFIDQVCRPRAPSLFLLVRGMGHAD
jgi:uracil phosphoribosyltransferase